MAVGQLEELIMLAIQGAGGEVTASRIREEIESVTQNPMSDGALYSSLRRLEEKDRIQSRETSFREKRGPRAYLVTSSGREFLERLKGIREGLDGTGA